MHFNTRAIHAGQHPDPSTGAIMTPIYQSSTYVQAAPGDHKGYEYSRTGNPTRNALEECLASLEGAHSGYCFGSGLAGTDAIMKLLKSGDHVISCDDLYGGTYRIFEQVYRPFGLDFDFVNAQQLDQVEAKITDKTKMIWIETPTNPLLKIVDIAGVSKLCKKHNLLLVVDNTFATPYLQQPIALGANLVLHSMTKYLGGHSDIVGGAVLADSKELGDKIGFIQNASGGIIGPMDSFLVLRGVKTLGVRMDRHMHNAGKILELLQGHDRVDRIYYPGLAEHPGHEIAKAQMSGFGGMLSFSLKGDDADEAAKLVSKTKIFQLAESLGGVESLIELPVAMTHGSIPPEERAKAGLSDALIRLSVGIEHSDDLVADLKQALG